MTPLFTKLNLKEHPAILVLNAPDTFDAELAALRGVAVVRTATGLPSIAFAIIFVTTLADIATAASVLAKAPDDPIIWFAYPKKSSRHLRCEFDRDRGWDAVGHAGFEGVRQIAIDEDWSALRFRRVEHVRTMTRDPARASSPAGKARTEKRGNA